VNPTTDNTIAMAEAVNPTTDNTIAMTETVNPTTDNTIAIIRSRESHDRQYNSDGRSVEIPKG